MTTPEIQQQQSIKANEDVVEADNLTDDELSDGDDVDDDGDVETDSSRDKSSTSGSDASTVGSSSEDEKDDDDVKEPHLKSRPIGFGFGSTVIGGRVSKTGVQPTIPLESAPQDTKKRMKPYMSVTQSRKLISAVRDERVKDVDSLLEAGADPDIAPLPSRKNQNAAIFLALECNKTHILKSLIEHGASLRATAKTPTGDIKVGMTPLRAAIRQGRDSMCGVILDHTNIPSIPPAECEEILREMLRYRLFGSFLTMITKSRTEPTPAIIKEIKASVPVNVRVDLVSRNLIYIPPMECIEMGALYKSASLVRTGIARMDIEEVQALCHTSDIGNIAETASQCPITLMYLLACGLKMNQDSWPERVIDRIVSRIELQHRIAMDDPIPQPKLDVVPIDKSKPITGGDEWVQLLYDAIALTDGRIKCNGANAFNVALKLRSLDMISVLLGLAKKENVTEGNVAPICDPNSMVKDDKSERPLLHVVAGLRSQLMTFAPDRHTRRPIETDEMFQCAVVERLITAGANVSATDAEGYMAIEYVRNGSPVCKQLLDPALVPNTKEVILANPLANENILRICKKATQTRNMKNSGLKATAEFILRHTWPRGDDTSGDHLFTTLIRAEKRLIKAIFLVVATSDFDFAFTW